jgi:3-oxoadipate CoA-transferase alpha subunit
MIQRFGDAASTHHALAPDRAVARRARQIRHRPARPRQMSHTHPPSRTAADNAVSAAKSGGARCATAMPGTPALRRASQAAGGGARRLRAGNMINKIVNTLAEALSGVKDGSTVLIGGFGSVGQPDALIEALIEQGATDLTCVANNAGTGRVGLARLMELGRVRKIICSFPRSAGSVVFEELYREGKIELEIVPQGTMAERMRAAGAGIPAFYTATSHGTLLAKGKEEREFDGRHYVMERALKADVALIEAWEADRWGNLTYNLSGRNFNPVMAMAADIVIAEPDEVVPIGVIPPDHVRTPGILVTHLVERPH